jgi:hypothetical protein
MFRAIVFALSLASASAFVAPAPARASVKVHETKAVSENKRHHTPMVYIVLLTS